MVEHQEHFGRKFYQDKKRGYWYSTDSPRIYAHRWVWINLHGMIPKGCHIHHKDENKSNNSPENLQLMSSFEHLRLHALDPIRRKKSGENCNRIRHLTKEWHASPEGKAWHSYHARKNNFGNWEPTTYTCDQCRKEFQSKNKKNVRFCSANCKSKWRRIQGLDNVEKVCANCSNKFEDNKYSRTKCCSLSCAAVHRWTIRKLHQ